MIVLFDLPTAASSSKASAFGDEATGEQNGTVGSESVLLGSCLGQKDPQWPVAGVRLTRPGRGFLILLFTPSDFLHDRFGKLAFACNVFRFDFA